MFDDVKVFTAAIDAAEDQFETTLEARGIPERCDYAVAYSECPRCGALEESKAVRAEARDAAWNALKASREPLAAWIAENCQDFSCEAEEVLRALPADMATLDALAKDNGWCEIWGDLRLKAAEAGVLPKEAQPEASGR